MTIRKEDLKPVASSESGFHEAVHAVVRMASSDVILGKNVHCFSGHDREELHKAASAIEMALSIQSCQTQSAKALQLIRRLVRDLNVFDTADSISGAELVDYMADFYQLAKSIG